MAYGFRNQDFTAVEGWCLEQVTLEKYHVMFWFNGNWVF
jgi:hypothetical protein